MIHFLEKLVLKIAENLTLAPYGYGYAKKSSTNVHCFSMALLVAVKVTWFGRGLALEPNSSDRLIIWHFRLLYCETCRAWNLLVEMKDGTFVSTRLIPWHCSVEKWKMARQKSERWHVSDNVFGHLRHVCDTMACDSVYARHGCFINAACLHTYVSHTCVVRL